VVFVFYFGTAKNSPFAPWTGLWFQRYTTEIPQYTKYSGISVVLFEAKSLAQSIKKEFSEVAWGLDFSGNVW